MTTEQIEPISASEGVSLELTRHFNATPERLFDAWTGAEWTQWLPPFGSTARVVNMDPQPGGEYLVAMHMPDGRDIEIHGKYLTVDRPHTLAMTWIGNYDNRETVLTVSLTPERNGTLLTLRQSGFAEQALQQGYAKGWSGEGGSFDKLAKLL